MLYYCLRFGFESGMLIIRFMSEVKKEKAKLKLSFKLVNEYEVAVLGLWVSDLKLKKKKVYVVIK